MKYIKAFTLIDVLAVVATLSIIAAMLISALNLATKTHNVKPQSNHVTYAVGDVVTIPTIGVTGVINIARKYYDYQRVDLITKSTNGMSSILEKVDSRLIQKVQPTPEFEWKR